KFGTISSKVVASKKESAGQYQDYFEFSEAISKCPSHRFLALARGEKEGFLRLSIDIDDERAVEMIGRKFIRSQGTESEVLVKCTKDAWKRLISPSLESQIWSEAKEKADDEAIKIFTLNLEQLLLAPPLGEKNVLAIDPGFRTGCKTVCLNKQ